MSASKNPTDAAPEMVDVHPDLLRQRVYESLRAAGADDASAATCTRALMHASSLGIDSHGVRLAMHYCRMFKTGRLNPCPRFSVTRTGPGAAMLDADNGLGQGAAYAAMEVAVDLARTAGIAACGVVRSSHLGPAGAYALAGAEAGMIAFATTNADKLVGLHDGTQCFHGTNPLAWAAPVPGEKPWLFDMATSSLTLNKVRLYRSTGQSLPDGVAADADGNPTNDPNNSTILIPLGGLDFGFKGAGLAGVATLLSAILTGGGLDHELIGMFHGDDYSTPRNLGHLCMAINPDKFVGRAGYESAIKRYVTALRAMPPRAGGRVMAPGDREWETEKARAEAIPVDLEAATFFGLVNAA
jgi:ureidoglycolate dehydrogenase (NAD+)